MDWLTGIQNAINYVEEHLTEDIDYEEVAKEAACSDFYFQRIFGILCWISLGDYIRNRRLTLAGDELSASDDKVINIALKYGYESPESFTRAFSKFHGVTPSEAKKDGSKLKSFSQISVKITLSGGNVMNYKIVEREAFDIIEKVETHSVEDSANAKSISDFWTRSHQDGTVKTLLDVTTDRTFIFGVCYGNLPKNPRALTILLLQHTVRTLPYRRDFAETPFLQEPGQYLSAKAQCPTRSKICGIRSFRSFSRHRATSLLMKWILRHTAKET